MEIKIVTEAGFVPCYGRHGDAGADLIASEDVTIAPGETVLVKTGLKMEIPEGYEVQIRPRSGLSLNTPLRIANAPGTIDSGYRGEVCVIMQNTSERYYTDGAGMVKVMPDKPVNHYLVSDKGNRKGWYDIKKGDRIAQMVVNRYETAEFSVVDHLSGSDRGEDGFGSTGTKANG